MYCFPALKRTCLLILSVFFCLVLSNSVVWADGEQTSPTTASQTFDHNQPSSMSPESIRVGSVPAAAEASSADNTWWSNRNAMTISAAVLVFGALFLLLLAITVRKKRVSTDELLKLFLTPLVVIMGVFLVVAGYTDQQITPVMTLLGTIVGFLFGRPLQSGSDTEPKKENNTAEIVPDIDRPTVQSVSITKQSDE